MNRIGSGRMATVALGFIGILYCGANSLIAAAPPVNDHFANATPLYGFANLTASNVGATAEPGEPAHAGEPAARSLWWRWTPLQQGSYSIVTSNSVATNGLRLDTTLEVYTGRSIDNLVRVVANDDTDYGEFGSTWSRAVFRAYSGENFYIAVDSIGPSGTIHMNVSLAGPIAQQWQALDVRGETVRSSEFQGKVVMVDFWEVICGACVEELPNIIKVQNAFRPRGFTFVGLSGDADPAVVREYVLDSPINYPIAMNNHDVEVTLTGGYVGYPTKVLLDPEGRIVGRYLGGNTEEFYRGIVEPLLRPSPSVRLDFSRGQESLNISWPQFYFGYLLQQAVDPLNGPWSTNTTSAVHSNNQYHVTLPASQSAQFFRLARP